MTFIRPIWGGLIVVSDGLVPGPALFPDAGTAERPQEILLDIIHAKNANIKGLK
jgi:hypothetical protein